MFTSEAPIALIVERRSWSHSRASAPLRTSGSVTISTSGVPPRLKSTSEAPGAVDAPRLGDVDELGGVLLEVHAVDADVAQAPVRRERDVVLGDLVRLRVVGIEVVLAVKDRARGDLAAEREADLDAVLDRLLVHHREAAGVGEADRAGVDVRVVAEGELAAAEHLRLRPQLDVDLQADDRLVASSLIRTPGCRCASSSMPKWWPISWKTVRLTSSAFGLALRKTTTRLRPPTGS